MKLYYTKYYLTSYLKDLKQIIQEKSFQYFLRELFSCFKSDLFQNVSFLMKPLLESIYEKNKLVLYYGNTLKITNSSIYIKNLRKGF